MLMSNNRFLGMDAPRDWSGDRRFRYIFRPWRISKSETSKDSLQLDLILRPGFDLDVVRLFRGLRIHLSFGNLILVSHELINEKVPIREHAMSGRWTVQARQLVLTGIIPWKPTLTARHSKRTWPWRDIISMLIHRSQKSQHDIYASVLEEFRGLSQAPNVGKSTD
jgi:hypothetical protein